MIGTFAGVAIGYVSWILATRLYSAEAIGLGSAIISAVRLLALFPELGMGIALVRFLPGAAKEGNDMINTCFTLSGLASVVVALVFLAGLGLWSPTLISVRQHPVFLCAFVVFTMVHVFKAITHALFLARRNSKFLAIQEIIIGVFKIALIALFAVFLNSAFGIFASTGLAVAVAMLFAVFWFLPLVQRGYRPLPMLSRTVLGQLLYYSLGNYVARTLLQLTPLLLPLLVVNILGTEANAYFYIAFLIGDLLNIIPSSIFNSLFAEASNDETSLHANSVKSLRLMLTLLLPVVLIVLLIAGKLLLLFGEAYSENSALALRIMTLSAIPWGLSYLYISIERVKKNVGSVIKIAALGIFLSVGFSYLLMSQMGIAGAALGYLAGQSIVAVIAVVHLWRGNYLKSVLGAGDK